MIKEAIPQLQPAEAQTDRSRRILIVDDDRSQVEVLSHRLQQQGFATLQAYEGRHGIDLARQQRPDLVLLDLRLPDVDGFRVCEELVDSPDTCDIPIIIVSGEDRPDIVRTSRAAGCEYFIRKPFDPNALLTLIQRALDRAWDGWDQ